MFVHESCSEPMVESKGGGLGYHIFWPPDWAILPIKLVFDWLTKSLRHTPYI